MLVSCDREIRKQSAAGMQELAGHEKQASSPLPIQVQAAPSKDLEGYFAGKLIMDSRTSGISGRRCPGFREALRLCDQCRKCHRRRCMQADGRCTADNVREKFGVTLEPEVKFLGEF